MMLGFLLLIAQPPADVLMTDAHWFGVDGHAAHAMYVMARDQRHSMRPVVYWNNPPAVVAVWEAEAAWRFRCWDKLDDVLYCSWPEGKKLESLSELRKLIGDEDYFAGRMPLPTPQYKVPTK